MRAARGDVVVPVCGLAGRLGALLGWGEMAVGFLQVCQADLLLEGATARAVDRSSVVGRDHVGE